MCSTLICFQMLCIVHTIQNMIVFRIVGPLFEQKKYSNAYI